MKPPEALTEEHPALSAKQWHLLRHALGLNRGNVAYRNYFSTDKSADSYADLIELVEWGYMTVREAPDWSGDGFIFHATDKGREAFA